MAKVISQATYDDVIKENIVEFSMTVEEARVETIQQFEAQVRLHYTNQCESSLTICCFIVFHSQGINLANIIKDLTLNPETGKPVLVESIDKLKAHSDGTEPLNDDAFEKVIDEITTECDKVGGTGMGPTDKSLVSTITARFNYSPCPTASWQPTRAASH